MFVTEDKIIEYPNKTILEDMLTRSGEATDDSYTPWVGCAEMMDEQFKKYYKDIIVTPQDIVAVTKDFSVNKSRATDDDVSRDVRANEVIEYHMNLENINRDYVIKYILEAIIGFKKNNNGLATKRKDVVTLNKLYDEEEGDYVDISDIKEQKKDFSAEEILEAKSRLPYLLKLLHDGSLKYGGSLLSFIIAAEKFFYNNPYAELRPRFLVEYGVYHMNRDGSIGPKFDIEENTGKVFPLLVKWVCGMFPNDIYYKAYSDLLRVLTVLDIDIKKEDAREYPGSYVKQAVCTYLLSNEEYVETYGFVDKKILSTISPDKLFEVARQFNEDQVNDTAMTKMDIAESIATNTENLVMQDPGRWGYKGQKVTKFLGAYAKEMGVGDKWSTRNYKINKGYLALQDDSYVFINISGFTDNVRDNTAMLSMAGLLVKVKPFDFTLEVMSVDDAVDYYERGNKHGWSVISI